MLLYFYSMIYFCICTHILHETNEDYFSCTCTAWLWQIEKSCAIEQERIVFNLLYLHACKIFYYYIDMNQEFI